MAKGRWKKTSKKQKQDQLDVMAEARKRIPKAVRVAAAKKAAKARWAKK